MMNRLPGNIEERLATFLAVPACLAVMLAAAWVGAEDIDYPQPVFSAAHENSGSRLKRIPPVASARQRPECRALWVTNDGIPDLVCTPSAVIPASSLEQPLPEPVEFDLRLAGRNRSSMTI